MKGQLMRIGFIGTGAITKAIISGLLNGGAADDTVIVSPRNAEVAARLSGCFPGRVTVAAGNQQVVDHVDVVVLAIRPQIAGEVLHQLQFRADQLVISLVAALSVEDLALMVAPATQIVRAVPLPSAAERASPTPIMPPDPVAKAIFDRTGTSIETSDVRAFAAMSAASGVMATYFAAAETAAAWLADNGLSTEAAAAYVRMLLSGLAGTAMRNPSVTFERLAQDHRTAGGLNEQFLNQMRALGFERGMVAGLGALLDRIAGPRPS
jgi:pyrroline-5-carboxylate reductase